MKVKGENEILTTQSADLWRRASSRGHSGVTLYGPRRLRVNDDDDESSPSEICSCLSENCNFLSLTFLTQDAADNDGDYF